MNTNPTRAKRNTYATDSLWGLHGTNSSLLISMVAEQRRRLEKRAWGTATAHSRLLWTFGELSAGIALEPAAHVAIDRKFVPDLADAGPQAVLMAAGCLVTEQRADQGTGVLAAAAVERAHRRWQMWRSYPSDSIRALRMAIAALAWPTLGEPPADESMLHRLRGALAVVQSKGAPPGWTGWWRTYDMAALVGLVASNVRGEWADVDDELLRMWAGRYSRAVLGWAPVEVA
jgi:hypothetical protein